MVMIRCYVDECGVITKQYEHYQRYFVVAIVMTNDSKKLGKAFKSARRCVARNKEKLVKELEETNEIKGASLTEADKAQVYSDILSRCAKDEALAFQIGLIVVDMQKMKDVFKANKTRSFNYLIKWFMQSFKEVSLLAQEGDGIAFLIDEQNVARDNRCALREYLNTELYVHEGLYHEPIQVGYDDSKNQALIQLADFVAGTASRALNGGKVEAKQNCRLLKPFLVGDMFELAVSN